MSIFAQIILFTFISGVLSLIGGIALLARADWVKKFSLHFISFAAGALLATAFLDLLPEALSQATKVNAALFWALLGIVLFFVIEKLILQFHSHHHEDEEHHHAAPILVQVGDSAHNFIDGVAIAAAFLANAPLGILTALAVAAHELPQEIGDFSIMLHHGWSRSRTLWMNVFSSLASIAGAIVAYAAKDLIEPYLPQLLGLTAGIFIYIASADLIPEISSKAPRDKTSHIIFLLILGVVTVGILRYYLE